MTPARFPSTRRRNTSPLEKDEQAAGVQLLRAIGSMVYTLGTRRSRGKLCPKCRTFVREDQGTRQTPGIGDVLAFLPPRPPAVIVQCRHGHNRDLCLDDACNRDRALVNAPRREVLWWEAKRSVDGRMSDDQKTFQALCLEASTHHCVGDRDDLIAWLIAHAYLKAHQVPHYRQPAGTGVPS